MNVTQLTERLFFGFFIFPFLLSSCKKTAEIVPPVIIAQSAPITVDLKHTFPELLNESSGLCYTDGNLWSFGDSGNPNSIFKIDTTTGAILQTVTIANYPNIDWEDITADSLYIYVGDIGNNDGNRTDLKILRIKKTDISANTPSVNVMGEAINFSYSDQTGFPYNSNTNVDCEALLSIENNLYLFTKDGGDLQTRCYKISKEPGTYSLAPFSSFNTNGKITAAAYNPVTKELALLGYMNQKTGSFIWFFNDYQGNGFFSGTSARLTFGSPQSDWQTEGLDYISTKRLMMSCESSTSHAASLYAVQKH